MKAHTGFEHPSKSPGKFRRDTTEDTTNRARPSTCEHIAQGFQSYPRTVTVDIGMWWSTVVVLPGQSIQEATTHPEQFICSYDGDVHGNRQAKKMARQAGRDFIRSSSVGQPRLVKTPIDPQLGFPPIDEEVIYSRDRQLGFYWVAPQRMEDLPAYGHPHLAFNRDVLGETRARKMAEAEMEKQQARAAQVGEDLPELTVHGSDYLLGPYVRSSDGVYVYDQAK